jgi:acetyl esterase/lipase
VRKVLVCGAAFAATCISAVAVPGGAEATPPTPAPGSSSPAVPGLPGGGTSSQTPSGVPGSTGPSTQAPDAQAPEPDPVVSTRAVMVTPKLPKSATYAYGLHPRQRLDAYWKPFAQLVQRGEDREGQDFEAQDGQQAQQAAKAAPTPAVLLFHGGSWVSGDKSSWKYFARRLTAQGYTVFASNYRLAPQAPWPAQRDDALAALAYVKKNAAKWNIDPNRIVAFGSSAGGLLASQLATYGEGATRVRGALSLSPANNPYLAYQDGGKTDATAGGHALRRAVVNLLGCVPDEGDPACLAQTEDANAATHVSQGDAPMLLMHFSNELVPATHSTGMAAALRGLGVPATVKVVPGTGHAGDLLNDPSVFPAIVSWLKDRTKS